MKRKTKRIVKRAVVFGVVVLVLLLIAGSYYLGRQTGQKAEEKKPLITHQTLPMTNKARINLYYYNKLKDKDKTFADKFVLPVRREIPKTKTPIQDAIKLLIQGKLTWQEKSAGFATEFPNLDFKLKSARLKNGILYLQFTEVPGFTTGGAGRVGLLAAQIEKTAKQFPQVRVVVFEPETLFQP